MDLENAWKKMGSEGEGNLDPFLPKLSQKNSTHPLMKIRKGLLITGIWGVVISIAYLIVMIYFPYWQVLACFSVVLVFNIYFIWTGLGMYRKIPDHISASHSLLNELKTHHKAVTQWMNLQMFSAKFIYPFAAAAGFMVGGMVGAGKDIEVLFSKPVFALSMLGATIIFTPIGIWISRKLFAMSYKKYLDQLEAMITELQMQD